MPQFLLIGRDHPGEPERRARARDAHLALAERLHAEGTLIHAGALLGEGGAMTGSVVLYRAESREALDALLMDEPYIREEVWAEVEITEIRPAPFL
ncbi:MAG: YciI family protein [Parvularcula sp.]|jgi:uncharacterized protein YciI|nr:YciI family protein [Parvularcula sp.]